MQGPDTVSAGAQTVTSCRDCSPPRTFATSTPGTFVRFPAPDLSALPRSRLNPGRDDRMHRWRSIVVSGHRAQHVVTLVKAGDAPGQRLERIPAGHQEVDRGAVRRRVDTETADDAQ